MAKAANHPSGNGNSHASGNSGFGQTIGSNIFKTNQPTNTKLDSQKPTVLNNTNPNKMVTKLNDNGKTFVNNKGNNVPNLSGNNSPKLKVAFLKDKNINMGKKDCRPCPWWFCWNYPCWCPLYSYGCGYWCNVPVATCQGADLQLLAVRTIDSGDPTNQLGPAFRVWLRNNSEVAINHPFNVVALAARNAQPTADLPQAGVRVDSIDAGQTVSVDIRLPLAANQPEFPMLHVLVDSHREIAEANELNNGLVIGRSDVLPVDASTPTSGGAMPIATSTNTVSNDTPTATAATMPTTSGSTASQNVSATDTSATAPTGTPTDAQATTATSSNAAAVATNNSAS
jgi:hypothetical protein